MKKDSTFPIAGAALSQTPQRKSNGKRFLPLLWLLFCMTLLPLSVQAQVNPTDYGLFFDVASGTVWLDLNHDGLIDASDSEYFPAPASWNWNSGTHTLTLNNFSWITPAQIALVILGGNLTVNLNGTNTFESQFNNGTLSSGSNVSAGIAVPFFQITITGSGTLNATGGDISGVGTHVNTVGINGTLTVAGGTVNATGGTATALTPSFDGNSFGVISVDYINIKGGILNAKGGSGTGASGVACGVYAVTSNTISGGTVEASGSTSAFNQAPVLPSAYKWWANHTAPTNPGGAGTLFNGSGTAYTYSASDQYVKIETATPPRITGPASMTLMTGYTAISTDVYTITGTTPVTVVKTSGDDHITWNNATRKLDIAEGLDIGIYKVELTASNGVGTFRFTFTLTVEERVYYLDIPQNVVGGTVEVITQTPYLAEEGETVTLIITSDEGYELESITVVGYDNSNIIIPLTCTDNVCTFTMPAFHVSIVVVFRPLTTGNIWAGHALPLRAWTVNGVLYVNGINDGATLRVYNIFGVLVYEALPLSEGSGDASIPLPGRGIYIITDGKETIKVVNN